jgi:hypothetical protein
MKARKQKAYIPISKIMEWWKKGHTSEGVKGGSFNLDLYLNYCVARENYEQQVRS